MMKRITRWIVWHLLTAGLLATSSCGVRPSNKIAAWSGEVAFEKRTDPYTIAWRFRPFLKFSFEKNDEPERFRPCSWQWFTAHSNLLSGDKILATKEELSRRPEAIIEFSNGDVRKSANSNAPYRLRIDDSAHEGEPWSRVVDHGDGTYVQWDWLNDDELLLVYWTLFAYDRVTVHIPGVLDDHGGDITAVSVVYSKKSDKIIRAYFSIHGAVLEAFDLRDAKESRVRLGGRNILNQYAEVDATSFVIADDHQHRFQDGPAWHSPANPEVFLVDDPRSHRPEHLAVFVEWGAHEPWPNKFGSATTAPKHTGDGISFLAAVRPLGALGAPAKSEEPFVFFNGKWDDPPSIVFHRSCLYPEGIEHNRFHIPDGSLSDRNPYESKVLPWPPP